MLTNVPGAMEVAHKFVSTLKEVSGVSVNRDSHFNKTPDPAQVFKLVSPTSFLKLYCSIEDCFQTLTSVWQTMADAVKLVETSKDLSCVRVNLDSCWRQINATAQVPLTSYFNVIVYDVIWAVTLNVTDVDECVIDNGRCEQFCVNSVGGFYCQCAEGFQLLEDGRNCERKTLSSLSFSFLTS